MEKPPEIKKINVSEFHDLMHTPFTRHCREMYGGPRRHIALWWEFIAVPKIGALTLCRIGRHRWCDAWTGTLKDCLACQYCEKTREK